MSNRRTTNKKINAAEKFVSRLFRAFVFDRLNLMKPKDLIIQWVEAFNKGDADLIAGFYADNAVNHQDHHIDFFQLPRSEYL